MTNAHFYQGNTNLIRILDENNSPVARTRLFSLWCSKKKNNRIQNDTVVNGDRGCLACGNCIDSCPVVREKQRFVFLQNRRTSMSLENIVGDECRRCYQCVRACPQVSKSVKEYVSGFRRGEKITHVYVATLIFFMAATGIFMFHLKELLPDWQQFVLRWSHFIAGLLLVMSPLIYYLLDSAHMKRALKSVFRFDRDDLAWAKAFWLHIKSPRRTPLPSWKEFNTYHKFWFSYLLAIIPLMALTGTINLFTDSVSTDATLYWLSFWSHSLLAMMTDFLILTHLYFKLIRHIVRDMGDLAKCMRTRGNFNYPFLYDPRSRS